MKTPRRRFIQSALTTAPLAALPVLAREKRGGYSHDEVTRKVQESGSVAGVSPADLSTPCLLLDLDRFELNIEKMSRHAQTSSVALRPHAKTHKCVEIARRQIKAGARGICVVTIAEAEVMSRAGVRGLLLTAEMVGRPKVTRPIKVLKKSPDNLPVVDHPDNVAELQQAPE